MTGTLSTLDYLIVAAYLGGTVILGLAIYGLIVAIMILGRLP